LSASKKPDSSPIVTPVSSLVEPRPTRRRILTAASALPVVAGLGSLSAHAQEQPERGIVGSAAPELDCEFWLDANGEPTEKFSMQAQRGKWVYMKLWQSWCPGCHSLGFPALKKVTDAFADDDRVQTLAIQTVFEGHSTNTGDKVREMQLRYEIPIPMGHDPGSKTESGYPNTMLSYRTGGTPWQVLIAPDGSVVFDGFRVNVDRVIEVLKEEVVKLG